MKKLTSIFLVLMLVLSLLPVGVLAQEGEETLEAAEQSDILLAEGDTNEPTEETTEETDEEATEPTEEVTEETGEETTEDSAEAEPETVSLALDGTDADDDNDKEPATNGNCGANGATVTWSFNSATGTLTISGEGAMANYGDEGPSGDTSGPGGDTSGPGGDTSGPGGDTSGPDEGGMITGGPDGPGDDGPETPWKGLNIVNLVIGDGVTHIGNGAFWGRKTLASVTIPDSVTSIGSHAFHNCSALASITIPSGVTSIGEQAFYGCALLTSVTIPDSATSLGVGVLEDCSALESVVIGNGVTKIDDSSFRGCVSLKSVTLPSGLKTIGTGAFFGCEKLTDISIPSGVTSIGSWAFGACFAMQSIVVGDLTATGKELEVEGDFPPNSLDGNDVKLTVKTGERRTLPAGISDKNAVFMDMTLDGMTDPTALHVPVCVTFAVPEGMDWRRVRLVHYGESIEVLEPMSYEYNGARYVYFSLYGFSPFALAELDTDSHDDTKPDVKPEDAAKPAAKTTDAKKPPRTGDESHAALWLAVALLGGCAVVGTTVIAKKKKYNQ